MDSSNSSGTVMIKKILLSLMLCSLTGLTGAVPVIYHLVPSFDGSLNTGYPFGDKPDTGDALPDCWTSVEIEDASPTVDMTSSLAEYDSGTSVFQLSATGGHIYNNDDSYPAFSCSFTADTTVTIEITDGTGSHSSRRFGLDIRDSNDPGSKHCFAGPFFTNGVLVDCRTATDGSTSSVGVFGPATEYPECMRIAVDHGVSARISYDSTSPCDSWTQVHEITDTDIVGGTFNINMALTPGGASRTATGYFANVTVDNSSVSHAAATTGFTVSQIDCNEDVGNCAITVNRSTPVAEALDLSVSFVDGTAQAGTHYTGGTTCDSAYDYTSGTGGNKTCNVPITDLDGTVQGTKSFSMVLSAVSGSDTISPTTITVDILDTDVGGGSFTWTEHTPTFTVQKGIAGYGLQEWDNVVTGSESYEYRFVSNRNTSGAGSLPNAYSTACPANTICIIIPTVAGKMTQSSSTVQNVDNKSRFVFAGQWAPGYGFHTVGHTFNIRDSQYHLFQMYSCFIIEPYGGSQPKASCINVGSSHLTMLAKNISSVNLGGTFAWDSAWNIGMRAENIDNIFPLIGPTASQGALMGENPGDPAKESTNTMLLGGVMAHVKQRCPLFTVLNGLIANQVCYNFSSQALRNSTFTNTSGTMSLDIMDVLMVQGPEGSEHPLRWSENDGTRIDIYLDGIRGFPDAGRWDDTPVSNMILEKTNHGVVLAGASVATRPVGFVRNNIPAGDAGEQEYAELVCSFSGSNAAYNRLSIRQDICDQISNFFNGSGDYGQAEVTGPVPNIPNAGPCDPYTANSCFPGQPALPPENEAGDADTFINKFWTANQAAFCAKVPAGYPGC